jgi:hypothetical protein
MDDTLDRKAFVTRLGAAGLGLGLALGVGRGGPAVAQTEATPPAGTTTAGPAGPTGSKGPMEQRLEMRQELYTEFTAALAKELNIANPDDVDAGIRKAMMAVVDSKVTDGTLTAGQGEAIKTLIATAEAPIAPGLGFGPGPVAIMHGGPEGGCGMGPSRGMGPGRGGHDDWKDRGRGMPGGQDRDNAGPAYPGNDDTQDEDDAESSS